ncbi:MAG TPA: helix-turn-helix domain-containing protein [Phenylobacterium sp.]
MSLAHAFDNDPTGPDLLAEAVRRQGLRAVFAKNQEIYAQADAATCIYLVVSGAVRTVRLMSDGRRQVAEFYYPGELFGLEPGPGHDFAAEAMCGAQILVLRRADLSGADGDAALESAIRRATRRELERVQAHLMLLGRKRASERVASFLSEMAARRGDGAVELPMSRQDIADYLGLTIETVSRTLTRLQNSNLVEFKGWRQFRVRNHVALACLAA